MSGLSLRWWPYRLALRRPLRSASGCILERRGFVLELRAADGARGFGDVAVWPGTESTTLPDARAWLDAFAAPDWLQCERTLWSALERLPASTAGARAARAAVETALLDLGARRSGIPLARALDAAAGSAVAVNALIGVAEVEETVALARAAVAAGFETVKLKVRIEPSDAERIAAVRAAIGPTVRIRLDANGLASVAQARAFAQAVAPVGIEYLEQPVATLEELAELRRCSPVPVAADEVLTGPEAVQRALDREAVDALVLKLPVLGGPLRLLQAAERAAQRGVEVIVSSVIESGIGLAAALHTAAALPASGQAHGLATAGILVTTGIAQRLTPVGGIVTLPEGSGLGVEWEEGQANG